MSLTKLEFRKIFTPMTFITLAVMLVVNIYAVFQQQGAIYAESDGKMQRLYEMRNAAIERSGVIDDEWIAARKAEAQVIFDDPQYRESDEMLEQFRTALADEGLSPKEIEVRMSNPTMFLNTEGSLKYGVIEAAVEAAGFKEHAAAIRDRLLEANRSDAEVCADISARYDCLINDYTAYYDYDWAYSNIQNGIEEFAPFTVGIPVLVGLAPLFARERSRKTDSLILSSKRGRRSVAAAKLCAGMLYCLLVWFVMSASIIIYALSFFGTHGFSSIWQASGSNITSPYLWTFGQAVIVELGTCLVGALLFGFIAMLFSELTKSMFVTVILGAAVLIVPMIVHFKTNVCLFLPTYIIRGVPIWSEYFPAKLFGGVVPMAYLSIVVSCILCIVFGLAAVVVFSKRQTA